MQTTIFQMRLIACVHDFPDLIQPGGAARVRYSASSIFWLLAHGPFVQLPLHAGAGHLDLMLLLDSSPQLAYRSPMIAQNEFKGTRLPGDSTE